MTADGSHDAELQCRIDELYAAEPERFVTVRTALVKELRAAKRRDEAKQVQALARPTLTAWAANRAARHHPELAERLAAAGRALAAAQQQAIETGDGAALRPAQAERRAAVAALADAAHTELVTAAKTSPARRDELVALCSAVSIDSAACAALQAGRLVRTPDATSALDPFGAATGSDASSEPRPVGHAPAPADPGPGAPAPVTATEHDTTTEQDTTEADAIERAQRALDAERERAEAELAAARRDAVDAERRRHAADTQRRHAEHEVRRAAAELAALRATLERATDEHQRTVVAAEEAAGSARATAELAGAARERVAAAEAARRALGE